MSRPAMYCDAYIRLLMAVAAAAVADPGDPAARARFVGHAANWVDCTAIAAPVSTTRSTT